ncbi:MAG: SDR family NAD(P)-dependent oxidoreductase [Bdellovibrionales bacterium]
MEWTGSERILVLGGSRGLGAELVAQLRKLGHQAETLSRKSSWSADFSKRETWPEILQQVREWEPQRLIYSAGGGPYGPFSKFQWKNHEWALRVTFEFPAYLLHSLQQNPLSSLGQVVVVGSSVAEAKPDPGAASYCAAKHALRGLIGSLQQEQPLFDLRLWSPGYMQTELLPLQSEPRRAGLARDPREVASLMIQSISDPALKLRNLSLD